MKKIILFLFLCLFATNVFCEKNEQTNYADWIVIPYTAKVTYIVAFSEGYVLTKEGSENYPYGYSYGALLDTLDEFYKNPQNRILPIPYALHYLVFPSLKNTWSKKQMEEETINIIRVYKQ